MPSSRWRSAARAFPSPRPAAGFWDRISYRPWICRPMTMPPSTVLPCRRRSAGSQAPARLRLAGRAAAGRPSQAGAEGRGRADIDRGAACRPAPIPWSCRRIAGRRRHPPCPAPAALRLRTGAGGARISSAGKLAIRRVSVCARRRSRWRRPWGRPRCRCSSALSVGLFSTGDEVRDPGILLRPGQIWDANRWMLRNLLEGLGCRVSDHGILPDDAGAVEQALQRRPMPMTC